jgi:hypothetical protein
MDRLSYFGRTAVAARLQQADVGYQIGQQAFILHPRRAIERALASAFTRIARDESIPRDGAPIWHPPQGLLGSC